MRGYSTYLFPLALVLCALVARIGYQSRHDYLLGVEYERAERFQEAVMQYDHSAHWYFPGNPFVEKSLSRLWAVGNALEHTNPTLSLWAYDSMRGSIYAVRSFYMPHMEWLEKVNPRIALLRAAQEVSLDNSKKYEDVLRFHQQKLSEDRSPHLGWSVVLEVSFFAWIFGVLGFIWKGFDAQGVMYFKPSIPWIGIIVGSFSLWIVSLIKA